MSIAAIMPPKKRAVRTTKAVLRKYPRICAHIICESLGYATPTVAASILLAVIEGKEHHCEWIDACYKRDPRAAVNNAIRTRRYHHGYMAEFDYALALVRLAIKDGQEPELASWF